MLNATSTFINCKIGSNQADIDKQLTPVADRRKEISSTSNTPPNSISCFESFGYLSDVYKIVSIEQKFMDFRSKKGILVVF